MLRINCRVSPISAVMRKRRWLIIETGLYESDLILPTSPLALWEEPGVDPHEISVSPVFRCWFALPYWGFMSSGIKWRLPKINVNQMHSGSRCKIANFHLSSCHLTRFTRAAYNNTLTNYHGHGMFFMQNSLTWSGALMIIRLLFTSVTAICHDVPKSSCYFVYMTYSIYSALAECISWL